MKKILALFLVIFMIGTMSFTAFADYLYDWQYDWDYDWHNGYTNRIEITFRVGDSLLNINGEYVEVETPYVVDGVTLVPVRVITEAFGADVEWIDYGQWIVLTYRNVVIEMQIDSLHVYVNGQRQGLLFPPQLTNGATMVPLRFITENFGADVFWNHYTDDITVTKDVFDDTLFDIEDVLRRSTMPMAGDSFFGWSLRRTVDMELGFRSFDGRRNTFWLDGSHATIQVNISDNVDDLSLDILQVLEFEHARRFTVTGHGIGWTSSGAAYVYTRHRTNWGFVERRVFLRDAHIVVVTLNMSWIEDSNERDEHTAILNTFDFVFNAYETEDLSNVVDGMRPIEIYEFNIEFRVPVEWWDAGWSSRMNLFEFDDMSWETMMETGYMSLEIFSMQDGDSIEAWANEYLMWSERFVNPAAQTMSEIRHTQINGVNAVYYRINFTNRGQEFIGRRMFWAYEGYMYTLLVEVIAENEIIIQAIIDSVSFEAIDYNEIEFILRPPVYYDHNVPVATVRNTIMGFSIDIPVRWSRMWMDSVFSDSRTGIDIQTSRHNRNFTLEEMKELLEDALESNDIEIIQDFTPIPSSELSSSELSGYMIKVKMTSDMNLFDPFYIIEYMINAGERSYSISAIIPERFFTPANLETVQRIIRSFVVN